jgi:hypothetical protein
LEFGIQTLVHALLQQVSQQLGHAAQPWFGNAGPVPALPQHVHLAAPTPAGGSNGKKKSRRKKKTQQQEEGQEEGQDQMTRYFNPPTPDQRVEISSMLLQLPSASAGRASYDTNSFGTLSVWDEPSTAALEFGEMRWATSFACGCNLQETMSLPRCQLCGYFSAI